MYRCPRGRCFLARENDETNEDQSGKGIFEDLSMAQVFASALAAATAFALSTQIGIAGSIIGAAIGAAASAVATQVYKNILSASADKIRANASDDGGAPGSTVRMTGGSSSFAGADGTAVAPRPQPSTIDETTRTVMETGILFTAAHHLGNRMVGPFADREALLNDIQYLT